jgi:hypothetical protein
MVNDNGAFEEKFPYAVMSDPFNYYNTHDVRFALGILYHYVVEQLEKKPLLVTMALKTPYYVCVMV